MTDNITKIANRTGRTRMDVRVIARDLGLTVSYSQRRRCYFIDEAAATVANFNRHMDDLTA